MASEYYQKHTIPEDFPLILRNFTREILRLQPKNIVEFSAKYFRALANKTQFTWDETKSRGPLPCDYPRVNIQKNLKEVPTTKQPIPYVSKKDGNGKTAESHETKGKDQKKDEVKTKQQTEHHEKKVTNEEKKVIVEEKKVVHEEKKVVHEEKNVVHEEKNVVHEEKNVVHEEKNVVHEEKNAVHEEKHVVHEEKKVVHEEKKVVHEEKTDHHEDQSRHPAPKHSRRSSDDHHANQSLNISGNISLPSNPEEAAEAYVGNLIERSEANLVNT